MIRSPLHHLSTFDVFMDITIMDVELTVRYTVRLVTRFMDEYTVPIARYSSHMQVVQYSLCIFPS